MKDRIYERKIKGITYYVKQDTDSGGKTRFMVFRESKFFDMPIMYKMTEEEAIKYLREYEA